jgi:dienelactone hydrolase
MADDAFFAGEGDIDAARQLVAAAPDAELFVYPGHGHLFEDDSFAAYDAEAATVMTERLLVFLGRVS